MRYTRIHSDREGESHFEDVNVELAPMSFAPPAPPLNLAQPVPSERMVLASVPPGWMGDWHPAPRRQFVLQLSGQLEVEVSDGEVRTFTAGSIVLLDDVSGKGHVTRAVGDAEVTLPALEAVLHKLKRKPRRPAPAIPGRNA